MKDLFKRKKSLSPSLSISSDLTISTVPSNSSLLSTTPVQSPSPSHSPINNPNGNTNSPSANTSYTSLVGGSKSVYIPRSKTTQSFPTLSSSNSPSTSPTSSPTLSFFNRHRSPSSGSQPSITSVVYKESLENPIEGNQPLTPPFPTSSSFQKSASAFSGLGFSPKKKTCSSNGNVRSRSDQSENQNNSESESENEETKENIWETIQNEMESDDSVKQYRIMEKIGSGTQGDVFLVRDDAGSQYALKVIKKKRKFGQKFIPEDVAKREISILKKCRHPNVVKLKEVMASDTKIYIVLEYLENGSIKWSRNDLPTLTIEEVNNYFRDSVLAIDYLHRLNIVHRDIKPDNLLVGADHRVKISDFGISVALSDDTEPQMSLGWGTKAYIPPELVPTPNNDSSRFQFNINDPDHGKAADIWSLGVTLYCLICGKNPFNLSSEIELYESILNDYVDLSNSRISPSLADLLSKMLEKDPQKRIKIEEIKKHPWVVPESNDLDDWLNMTEPSSDSLCIEPSHEELSKAVTILSKFKKGIRRMSQSLTDLFERSKSTEPESHPKSPQARSKVFTLKK